MGKCVEATDDDYYVVVSVERIPKAVAYPLDMIDEASEVACNAMAKLGSPVMMAIVTREEAHADEAPEFIAAFVSGEI